MDWESMDLKTLKEKYRNKASVNIKDVDIAMKAVPFLVREVCRLESELSEAEKRINFLTPKLARRHPLKKSGSLGDVRWETRVDEKKNILYMEMAGRFNYRSAKTATSHIMAVTPNLRPGFDLVVNLDELDHRYDRKFIFHLRKVIYNLNLIGIGKVVCILNPKVSPIKEIFGEKSQAGGYSLFTARTVHEAEGILENAGKYLQL